MMRNAIRCIFMRSRSAARMRLCLLMDTCYLISPISQQEKRASSRVFCAIITFVSRQTSQCHSFQQVAPGEQLTKCKQMAHMTRLMP